MKNLGVISLLLVVANLALAQTVFAEANDSLPVQGPIQGKVTLAMNEVAVKKEPLVKIETESFGVDEQATLLQVNARLEQKLEQKFDSLLADQLETLNLP